MPPAADAALPDRLLAVCGWSGAGKTWVVEQLVSRLTAAGLRVATVKHHGSGGAIESADKDTARHQAAGAVATALSGDGTTVWRSEEASLDVLAKELLARGADLVIAEGFKAAPGVPKIEVAARGRERVHAAPRFALLVDAPQNPGELAVSDEGALDALAARIRRALP